ncbi:hypothetical protein [Phenylobacterium sp.]|uniref:hypothetical protein n=1 Tax=Phenylobacterium sp. TaxID=1871053 RepID=UPI0011FDC260|nr:hypothetical protein [Phenylobacterium sp.]THD64798.1 MAG: hypothetical protein E8A49_01755 [Phenylobacterium sp.]
MANLFLALSIALYISSLALSPFGGWPGWADLAFGWLGIGSVLSSLCWFANPILWLTWSAIGSGARREVSAPLSIAALACAGSFLFMRTALAGEGPPAPIGPLRIGYWLWLASIAVAGAGAFLISPPSRSAQGAAP